MPHLFIRLDFVVRPVDSNYKPRTNGLFHSRNSDSFTAVTVAYNEPGSQADMRQAIAVKELREHLHPLVAKEVWRKLQRIKDLPDAHDTDLSSSVLSAQLAVTDAHTIQGAS